MTTPQEGRGSDSIPPSLPGIPTPATPLPWKVGKSYVDHVLAIRTDDGPGEDGICLAEVLRDVGDGRKKAGKQNADYITYVANRFPSLAASHAGMVEALELMNYNAHMGTIPSRKTIEKANVALNAARAALEKAREAMKGGA